MLNQLNNITIEALEAYLLQDLWKQKIDFPNKKVKLFKKVIGKEEFSLTIPARNDFRDSQIRIKSAVELLSNLKGISVVGIANNISKYSNNNIVIINKDIQVHKREKDILSFRIISKLSKDGTIPLEYGSSIVEGLKKLVLSAIFNEEDPKPYFLKTSRSAYEKLFKYRLAQTQVGSYIFNIEVDSRLDEQLMFNDEDQLESISEERKVIRRIQNGIRDVKEKDMTTLLEDGYKKGLNANMCYAIMNLNIDDIDIRIESKV